MDKWKGEEKTCTPRVLSTMEQKESETALVERGLSPVTTQEVESWKVC